MRQEREITEQEFKTIYTDKKMRNAVAYAHTCCNKEGEGTSKIALYGLDRLKVTLDQIKEAKALLEKQAEETKQRYKHSLLFVGMGMTYETDSEIGNHRIRTEFLNAKGKKVFVEFGKAGSFTRCDHSIDRDAEDRLGSDHIRQGEFYNYKGLEHSMRGWNVPYTPGAILNLVNKTFDCHFYEIFIDNYDLECAGIMCESPKPAIWEE